MTKTPLLKNVPLASLKMEPQVRSRMDKTAIAELAADIEARGVLQPILVRKTGKKYTVIAGHRRSFASEMAGLKEIPALITTIAEEDVTEAQLVENLQREDLDAQDIGAALSRLYEQHASLDTVALMVNRSKSWVSKHIKFANDLHWECRALWEQGYSEDIELLNLLGQILYSNLGANTRTDALAGVKDGRYGRDELRAIMAQARQQDDYNKAMQAAKSLKPAGAQKAKRKTLSQLVNLLDGTWSADYNAEATWTSLDDTDRETVRATTLAAFDAGRSAAGLVAAFMTQIRMNESVPEQLARLIGYNGKIDREAFEPEWLDQLQTYADACQAQHRRNDDDTPEGDDDHDAAD